MDKGNNTKETEYDVKGYALSGKIMLISIAILFIIVVIMLCIHAYARWYLHRARRIRRSNHRSRASRSHLIFYVDPSVMAATRGLDAAVIASLPVFVFSSKTQPDPVVDCPVCLSEFEEGETGRVLPKCNHTFHTECIDMWFQSHSTCPLCRAPVEPLTRPELVVTVCEPQTGSTSGLCEEWKLGADELNGTEPAGSSSTTSSNGLVRKPSSLVGVSVEVPGRNNESGCASPSLSFRSPMSSVMSLKRILSRERKASVSSSSSGCAAGCSSSTSEFDAERGERVEIQ